MGRVFGWDAVERAKRARAERGGRGPLQVSVVQSPEVTAAGNITLAVGRPSPEEGAWSKTEHVVLSPKDAMELHDLLGRAIKESVSARKAVRK